MLYNTYNIYNIIYILYSLAKFVILIFVREKMFVQVYSNPDEFPVSNFRHLTLLFVTSDRKQYKLPFLPQNGCVGVRAVNDDVFSLW